MRAENVREAENFANIEINKISKWAEDNKITFNEQKSKVMVVTRRKRKESTNISIYLNNKPLEQVNNIKNLGNIIDSKLNFREHIIQTKILTYIHIYTHNFIYTFTHTHINTYIRTYTHTHIPTYIHSHKHTYTLTHVYT